VYHDFLWSVLPELLQEVDLHAVGHAWWCSTTFLLAVWIFLNILEQWIWWDGSIAWPAHSFDLNSVDFYVWIHLKSVVYDAEFSDIQVLQQQIQNGLEVTHVTPEIFQWVRRSLLRRAAFCIES
jgi:hypothetical protein